MRFVQSDLRSKCERRVTNHRFRGEWWQSQSLARQFLLAGGVVTLAAMALVGWLVTTVITSSVTRNAAATTALYVDSIIAPLLPDMQTSTVLSDGVARALDETLDMGALGNRLVAFKLWRADGTILYSKNHAEIGRRIEPSADLLAAWSGQVVAQFNDFDELEKMEEGAKGLPLLEIYNPILQPWSGEVVTVSEFYEVATDLQADLQKALVQAWAVVAVVALGIFVSLYAIVSRGSQTIAGQRAALKDRVDELTTLLGVNETLRRRVQDAAQRSAAMNERHLRRIGADLHDGPAQLIALAALRMETDVLLKDTSRREKEETINSVRQSLDDAMVEIRSICNGLVLPNIESAPLDRIISLAAHAHAQRTATNVELDQRCECDRALGVSVKICAFRFVQEGLSNAYRHAGGSGQQVRLRCSTQQVVVEVKDAGPGFDPDLQRSEGLGLAGLRDRIESLGGLFGIETSAAGTRLSMVLNREDLAEP